MADAVVSGIVLGSLYALVASGLSLIWSTLKVFNFAHGALMMLGAYLTWTFTDEAGASLLVGALAAIAVMALGGVVAELLLIRPFIARPSGDLLVMVATLAAATMIQNGAQLIWGPRLKQLPEVGSGAVDVLGTSVGANQLAAVVVAPVLLAATAAFLRRARLGLAIRAVEQNRDFARLVAISPRTVYVVTLGLASGLAATAGVLLGGIQFVTPTMGSDPLLKAFVVVAFGGLASLRGTVAAAYVIGMLEAMSIYLLGLYWAPLVIFATMIAVMLVRPEGLVVRRRAAL
jgi:branched-chain amino acid transport system permease protein